MSDPLFTLTKVSKSGCWLLGWAHLLHAMTLILSLGFITSGFPARATLALARVEHRKEHRT